MSTAEGVEIKLPEHLKITVEKPVLVRAVGETTNTPLFLSNMDLAVVFPVELVYFYKAKAGSPTTHLVEKMKEGLERLLVHYYFMAGRLRWNEEEDRMEIDCNNAGVLFAGASSQLTLDEIGDISRPNPAFTSLILRALVLDAKNLAELPLATAQVTRFKCGGFAVGLSANHILFDGTAAGVFLINYASHVRGGGLLVEPNPDRTGLRARSPPQIQYEHPEFVTLPFDEESRERQILLASCYPGEPSEHHVYRTFAVSGQMLNRLKVLGGPNCTSFEALAAHVWQCRTAALEMDSEKISSISFAVDVRKSVNPPLPTGFVGNALIDACARLPAGEVSGNSLSFVVEKVQEAKARATDEDYIRSTLDFLEKPGTNSILVPTGWCISSWWRMPLHYVDFGWGKPIHAGPVTCALVQFVLFLYNGTHDGLNVYLALEAGEMAKFEQLFYI